MTKRSCQAVVSPEEKNKKKKKKIRWNSPSRLLVRDKGAERDVQGTKRLA